MKNEQYLRFATRVVNIGEVPMGGHYPIRVQSMTNTITADTKATVAQAIRMINAGCEYVRITVPSMKDVDHLKTIKIELRKQGYKTPLIADVHFNAKIAEEAAKIVEKVRINPGNYRAKYEIRSTKYEKSQNPIVIASAAKQTPSEAKQTPSAAKQTPSAAKQTPSAAKQTPSESNQPSSIQHPASIYEQELDSLATNLRPLLKICKQHGTAIRIGVNHGSLSSSIMERYGDTPEGMVESALEFARICKTFDFDDLVLSMKASNTRVMINANRLLVEKMKLEGFDYPLHLGVTEAGSGEDGRIKSAIGIGSLLADGIGDTIRVSITEDPEFEIPVAYGILQATGVRITKTEFISCPSCGRTLFNIQETLEEIKKRTGHLKGLKIAVMGCIVNGPGEMADAHYGYIGAGKRKVNLYKGQLLIKRNIDEAVAVDELIALIKVNGDWLEKD